MAQPQLTLRQPPNVDFIAGYPGIAAALPNRGHAEVHGTLEFRVPQPIKAKWVRVEFRKIELTPGGGQFVDHVGQSPLTVWKPEGEWGILSSQDFEFHLRIPESIPPSIMLENRSGIRYELMATVCTKGKRGFLRKESSPTFSATTELVVYKHELHSNWPVYAQPDQKQGSSDGLTLIVARNKTAIGPEERLPFQATLRSEGPIPANLRSFELALKETITFKSPPSSSGSKQKINQPMTTTATISEQKIPVNVILHHGMQHSVEMICALPPNFRSMSVDSARYIDIRFTMQVTGFADGRKVQVDIPITVSPFPLSYSQQVIEEIGPPPSALDHPSRAHLHQAASSTPRPSVYSPPPGATGFPPSNPSSRHGHPVHIAERVGGRQSALLTGGSQFAPPPQGPPPGSAATLPYGNPVSHYAAPNGAPPGGATYGGVPSYGPPSNEFGQKPPPPQPSKPVLLDMDTPPPEPPAQLPPKFTLINGEDDSPTSNKPFLSAEEEKRRLQGMMGIPPQPQKQPQIVVQSKPQAQPQPVVPSSPPPKSSPTPPFGTDPNAWLSAEEEKKKLYQQAKAKTERAQRKAMNANLGSSSGSKGSPKGSQFSKSNPGSASTPTPSNQQEWLSAEEEKKRLYEKAQAAVKKTQSKAQAQASAVSLTQETPIVNPNTYAPAMSMSSGAELYKSAIAAVKANEEPKLVAASPARVASPPLSPPPAANNGGWLTAEQEKEQMRYYEAKKAVDRHLATQTEGAGSSSGGYGYDAPPPDAWEQTSYASPPPVKAPLTMQATGPEVVEPFDPSPPPFDPPPPSIGYSYANELPEKEKMRLAFEARDNMLARQNGDSYGAPPPGAGPSYEPPPPDYGGAPSSPPPFDGGFRPLNAFEEKARLKAQYAMEDTSGGSGSGGRSPPPLMSEPPMYGGETRPLTAAEEKAMLKARMAADQPVGATPPAPPPRLKSPPPSTNGTLSGTMGSSRPPTFISQSSSNSFTSEGVLARDPSISRGKQRAIQPFASSTPPPFAPPDLHNQGFVAPPPPPPLAPRPPKSYIEETREEDAKIRRLTTDPVAFQAVVAADEEEEALRVSRMPSLRVSQTVPWSPPPGSMPYRQDSLLVPGSSGNASSPSDFVGLRPFSPLDLSLGGFGSSPAPSPVDRH